MASSPAAIISSGTRFINVSVVPSQTGCASRMAALGSDVTDHVDRVLAHRVADSQRSTGDQRQVCFSSDASRNSRQPAVRVGRRLPSSSTDFVSAGTGDDGRVRRWLQTVGDRNAEPQAVSKTATPCCRATPTAGENVVRLHRPYRPPIPRRWATDPATGVSSLPGFRGRASRPPGCCRAKKASQRPTSLGGSTRSRSCCRWERRTAVARHRSRAPCTACCQSSETRSPRPNRTFK